MNIGRTKWLGLAVFLGLTCLVAQAQTPTPPYIGVVKQMNTTGEICPGGYIDVSIHLVGAGSTAFLRYPINAVSVIDKSGSMSYGGTIGWNEFLEPPYAPIGTPGYNQTRYNPYATTVWAAWKFYQYFVDNPPSIGYDDYGGLVFYSNRTGLPGAYAQVTPTPIQRVRNNPLDPSHKNYWWHNRLARQYPPGGGTAIGPAMQFSRDIIDGMPLHVPIYTPGNPTPSTPKPSVEGNNFMVVLTDGQPNDYWTPAPSEQPPWAHTAYSHCIEMARRCALGSPWGAYNDVWDITIFTIGLGSSVDTGLLSILADPWNWAYMSGTPTPTDANHGFFTWALTEDDLIDAFEAIAGTIVSNLAGSDIYVLEVVPSTNMLCPGGETVLTEIDPSTINPPPTILPPSTPGNSPEYTWNFQELFIGDELEITFTMMIPTAAPTGVFSLIECPSSNITYLDYQGIPAETPIYDPGFMMGICDGPTHTPTPSPTMTPTPTCIPGPLFYDDFETANFNMWDSAGPTWGVSVYADSDYAYAGDYFAYFAGSELPPPEFGYNEGSVVKFLNFADPIRPGAVLECYVRIKGFSFPQKDGKPELDDPYDIFIVEVSDFNGHFVYKDLDYQDMQDDYFQVRLPLTDFAGSDAVRIRMLSYFPVTVQDPPPSSNEPMAFLDEVLVWDFCYAPSPTPTPTDPMGPIIPSTSSRGIGVILMIISILIVIPLLRRAG